MKQLPFWLFFSLWGMALLYVWVQVFLPNPGSYTMVAIAYLGIGAVFILSRTGRNQDTNWLLNNSR